MAISEVNIKSNFVADLDLTSMLVTPERCIMLAPLTDAVRSSKGSSRVGVLSTMLDVACSDPALAACRPDWTATQDLSVHAIDWLVEGPMVVDAQLLRIGKKTIVISAIIYDGHGRSDIQEIKALIDGAPKTNTSGEQSALTPAAKCLLTFARIPGTAASGAENYTPAEWVGKLRRRTPEGAEPGEINEKIGMNMIDAENGVIEVNCIPYIINAIGTINGGVQTVILEVAAESMRPGLVATDIQVNFLSQLKVGPARTSATVLRDAADHSVVSLQLMDAGNDDKLLTLATVLLQKP